MNKTFPRSLSQGMPVELHMNLVKHFMALSFCHVLIVFVFHEVDILYDYSNVWMSIIALQRYVARQNTVTSSSFCVAEGDLTGEERGDSETGCQGPSSLQTMLHCEKNQR